ncbi:hypothetical protein OAE61_00070 [Verrucomicrobiales bacterium]|nr:hypothetical protein [bacterium]MDB4662007.1 hypothetical protein [Verrucomicrobiales bacterium]MDC0275878.1 hypothetical protein [Verrucomicrobiales bacterium]MDC0321834.1 hypothetical protein [Verrucomicrobiales bacterium]
MNNLFKTEQEFLALEDDIVSATELPADATASKIAYETATFGMG